MNERIQQYLERRQAWYRRVALKFMKDIEVNDDAQVKITDGGAYVQAWLWVPLQGEQGADQLQVTWSDTQRSPLSHAYLLDGLTACGKHRIMANWHTAWNRQCTRCEEALEQFREAGYTVVEEDIG